MSNSIDLVIGSEAIKQVEKLIDKLNLADAELIKVSQSALNASKGISGISTPSGLDNSVSNAAALNAQLEKQNVIITNLHANLAKKAEQSRLSEIRLQQAREKAFDNYSSKLAKQESEELAKSNKVIAQKEKEFSIFEKQFNKYESELAKKAIQEEKASQKAISIANKQQIAEEKQALSRRQAFDKNDQKLNAQAAKEVSAYQRIQNSVNLLTKTYQDLAIRKQLGNTLSVSEEKQLASITSRLNTYQNALKSVDANMQKHTRNVGNYSSGFNGLGNSINQITRELPAFTFSAQTGFLALSNNIPILTDEIGRLVRTNKELSASGKPVTSVFKQILGGVFSLQTAMGIGILLFTLYGKEIGAFFSTLFKGKEVVRSLAQNHKLLNETLKDSSGNYAEEKVNIESLYIGATNLNRTYKDRLRDVNKLQELYPYYFKNLSDEAIMAGEAKDQYNLLSQAIVTAAKARASEDILKNRESERLVTEQKDVDLLAQKYEQLKNAKGTSTFVAGGGSVSGAGTSVVSETAADQKIRLKKEINKLREESVKQREEWAKEDAFFIAKISEGNAIADTLGAEKKLKIEKPDKAEEDRLKAVYEAQKKELELQLAHIDQKVNNDTDYYTDRLTALDEDIIKRYEIAKLDYSEELRLSKDSKEKQKIALINYQLDNLKLIEDYNKKKGDLEKLGLKPVTELATSTIEKKDPFKDVIDSAKAATDSIKGHGDTLKSDWKETFDEIAELAQRGMSIIADFSDMNFRNEYQRLSDQKDIAIQFAGESAEAKLKIEADYEKKRKDIANRENKAKQKQAIFNIAIDTAQAIMATVGKTGFAGLPLALILGTLGAAQIAMVAAQKIPQYFEGGTHDGGLMLVNDAKGSNYKETIVTPDGKILQPTERNVVMDAPKGTQIFTPEQWHEKQLFDMMQGKGIAMTNNYAKSNGLTYNEMDSIISKHFANITTQTNVFDKNGFNSFSANQGNVTIRNNNRSQGLGFSV